MFDIYIVMAISCLLFKETINEVQTKVKDKTSFIRLIQVDVEMLCEKCTDKDATALFKSFAEAVRYSDPISVESLCELEKEIAVTVSECSGHVSEGDYEKATELCKKAQQLLSGRNKKCKALK